MFLQKAGTRWSSSNPFFFLNQANGTDIKQGAQRSRTKRTAKSCSTCPRTEKTGEWNKPIIFAHPSAIHLARRVLASSSKDPLLEQLISFDTTFECGDAYVTAITVRNIEIEGDPIFPVIFMFHENPSEEQHAMLWNVVERKLGLSKLINIPVACDREKAPIKAFKSAVPGGEKQLVFCHNHILRNVDFWLKKNGLTKNEIKLYKNEVLILLESTSKDEFAQWEVKFLSKWSLAFKEYYIAHLAEDIRSHAAKFIMKRFAAFKNKTLSNNISESLNRMMKVELHWKEHKLDFLFILLFQLQHTLVAV